jgi:2-polyprenyl-3-methyl-5-hydroxy-6-metoxy-1,4-benzoquinol methylase
MSEQAYLEFEWSTAGPANGESGRGLAEKLIGLIRGLEGIDTICDLGCGNGYLANQLSELGYNVTGVDASTSGIELARETQGKTRFVQSTIDKEVKHRTGLAIVDLVVSSDVVEHLYRPADLLEAAESLLKPNGQILITAPYHGYLKNLTLALSGRMDGHFSALHDGGHIKFFSVRTLAELINRHSFTDLKFSYYGRAPWLWKNMICHARRTY